MTLKTTSEILQKENFSLTRLWEKAKELQQLEQWVNESLPASLKGQVKVANYREKILVLGLENPIWATELRHQSAQLITYLTTKKVVVDKVEIITLSYA